MNSEFTNSSEHDWAWECMGGCTGLGSWTGTPWQREPRLGEAANPGPGFDDSDGDFGGSEDSWGPLPGDGQWQPPGEEEHAEFDEQRSYTSASSCTAVAVTSAAAAAGAVPTEEEK